MVSSPKSTCVILLLAICTAHVSAQLLDCNFQEVHLLPCLSNNTTEACCAAFNHALTVGHRCLCSILLSYTNPNLQLASASSLFTVPSLAWTFPGCALVFPSLTACEGVPLELNSPPVPKKEPVLTPTATTAPAPKPLSSSSTNSSKTPTETSPQLVKEVPGSSKSIGPVLGYKIPSGSTGVRLLQVYKPIASLVWVITIYAWIV